MTRTVATEMRGDIALLILDRPDALNAISADLARDLAATLIELDADPAVQGIVLTGAGDRAFCAGVDLQEARDIQVHQVEEWFGRVCNCYRQILMTEKPVIAALNGVATGGGFQLSLVSDLRVAHAGVRAGQPEIKAGIPSAMGSYWMSLHLGWSMNQELAMNRRLMEAAEAQRVGPPDRAGARPGRAFRTAQTGHFLPCPDEAPRRWQTVRCVSARSRHTGPSGSALPWTHDNRTSRQAGCRRYCRPAPTMLQRPPCRRAPAGAGNVS